jgi:hypothetical protein
MVRTPRLVRGKVPKRALVWAVTVVALLVLPAGAFAAGASRPAVPAACSGTTASYGVSGTVLWNGVDICTATTASSALGVNFADSANLTYTWSWPGTGSHNLTDARLQMFYFGFALATRDVPPIGSGQGSTGSFDMNWDPGALTYVFAGLYGLTASILDSNGTTVWSENFFVKATAPYSILAALPILLLILGIYELYAVARSGSQAAIATKRKTPPAAPPPTTPATAEEGGAAPAGAEGTPENPEAAGKEEPS